MKNNVKYILIILFCAVNLSSAQNQLSAQWEYANNLFNSKQYFDSITELKRLLFFDIKNDFKFDANFRIGQAYKFGAKFDEAINYFSIADRNSVNDKQLSAAKLEIVKTNILRKTPERALQLLNEIEKGKPELLPADSINYWRGWAFMFMDDWKSAENEFAKINSYNELKFICSRVENQKVSVTFAKVISYILPGSGQIYSGQTLSGLLSFGYNVLFGYLTINAFDAGREFDGSATGLLLWLRFYRGNIQNAENFAVEKNLEIANSALRFIQNNYQGPKP